MAAKLIIKNSIKVKQKAFIEMKPLKVFFLSTYLFNVDFFYLKFYYIWT